MDPMTGLMIANLASSGIQAGVGAWQTKQAKDILADLDRPIQKTPESATKSVKMYESMTGKNAPGYSAAIENIDAGTARTARAIRGSAGSSQEALQALLSLDAQNKDSFRGLDAQNDSFQQRMMELYGSGLNMLAGYEQDNFDWNEKSKFLEETAAASALTNAGIVNKVNSADKALSTTAIPYEKSLTDNQLSSNDVSAMAKTANTATTAGGGTEGPATKQLETTVDGVDDLLAYNNADLGTGKKSSVVTSPEPSIGVMGKRGMPAGSQPFNDLIMPMAKALLEQTLFPQGATGKKSFFAFEQ